MSKKFTIIKNGYRAGVYGCISEYFTAFLTNGEIDSFKFHGLYGTEDRVATALKNKGYKEYYTSSTYGQLVREDVRFHIGEKEAIEKVSSLD